jgi:hypothetical protein
MAAGAVAFIGQFTAWTYITPFLMEHTHLSSGVLPAVRHLRLWWHRRLTRRRIAVQAPGDRQLRRGGGSGGRAAHRAGEYGHCTLAGWPVARAVGPVLGNRGPGNAGLWILDAAPETPEAASAVNVTNLQIALAAGSGLGAILVSSTTLRTVFLTAGFIVLAAAVLSAVAALSETLARRE